MKFQLYHNSSFPFVDCALDIDMIQVELTRMQLKRAKRRTDTQDIELAMDMMVVFSKKDERNESRRKETS